MNRTPIKIKKLNANASIPEYGTEFAAGADVRACIDEPLIIEPGQTVLIHTGFSVEIPVGYAGFMFARSGMASKKGLAPANKVGVIDSDYRGEVMVALHNHGNAPRIVEPGDRIAQLVIMPYLACEFLETEELSGTERGEGGLVQQG